MQRRSELWSAVTWHRFYRMGDSSPKQRRAERRDEPPGLSALPVARLPQSSTATSRLPKAVTSHRTPRLARVTNAELCRQVLLFPAPNLAAARRCGAGRSFSIIPVLRLALPASLLPFGQARVHLHVISFLAEARVGILLEFQ